jgi:ABC-type multidrug transport system ATPase subunit
MKIKLSGAGKRFNREWVFRKVDLEFTSPGCYAITGPNGSGKSTLLQVLGCMLLLSEGSILYSNNRTINLDNAHEHTSFCAPYMDVVEEMTLIEFFSFHNSFKPFMKSLSIEDIIERMDLKTAAQKQIRYYSSGMKQRVRLAQAFFSNTEVILLDEPCSNLDETGVRLYHSLVDEFCRDRLTIISSNDEIEYSFCENKISVLDYK